MLQNRNFVTINREGHTVTAETDLFSTRYLIDNTIWVSLYAPNWSGATVEVGVFLKNAWCYDSQRNDAASRLNPILFNSDGSYKREVDHLPDTPETDTALLNEIIDRAEAWGLIKTAQAAD